MRFRSMVTAGVTGFAALALMLSAPAASAAPSEGNPNPNSRSAATWTETTSRGGPIRECYAATCDPVWDTYLGERVYWSHWAINSSGNRWYYVYVTYGSTKYYGWIYCGNIVASC